MNMKKFKWVIIGLVIYLVGGWIVKQAVFSIIEITGDMTLKDIARYEMNAYISIPIVLSLISSIIKDNNAVFFVSLLICLITSFLVEIVSYSVIAVILFNIVNIGIVVWSIYPKND